MKVDNSNEVGANNETTATNTVQLDSDSRPRATWFIASVSKLDEKKVELEKKKS